PALFTFFVRLYVPESARWQRAVSSSARPSFREIFSMVLRRHAIFGGTAAALVMFAIWGGVQFTQLWAAQLAGPQAAAQVQRASAGAAAIGALAAPILLFRVRRRLGYCLLSAAALVSGEYLFLAHKQFDNSFLVA